MPFQDNLSERDAALAAFEAEGKVSLCRQSIHRTACTRQSKHSVSSALLICIATSSRRSGAEQGIFRMPPTGVNALGALIPERQVNAPLRSVQEPQQLVGQRTLLRRV